MGSSLKRCTVRTLVRPSTQIYVVTFPATNLLPSCKNFFMSNRSSIKLTGWRSTRRLGQISSHLLHNSATSTRRPIRYLCSASNTGKPTDESKRDDHVIERIETVPNETWSKETLDLYNKLQNLVESSNGAWKKFSRTTTKPGYRNFAHSSCDEKGKLFEYCMFYNETERSVKVVCQFGPYTEGPEGFVHGGAIATMLDKVTSAIRYVCGISPTRTANLGVTYKNALPIGSTVLVLAKLKSVDGRKVFSDGEMTSPDGLHIYATAKTLCIQINNKENEIIRKLTIKGRFE